MVAKDSSDKSKPRGGNGATRKRGSQAGRSESKGKDLPGASKAASEVERLTRALKTAVLNARELAKVTASQKFQASLAKQAHAYVKATEEAARSLSQAMRIASSTEFQDELRNQIQAFSRVSTQIAQHLKGIHTPATQFVDEGLTTSAEPREVSPGPAALVVRVPSITSVSEEARPEPLDRNRAIPEVDKTLTKLDRRHAPRDWASSERERFQKALRGKDSLELIVVSADIRGSTDLMKEAVDPFQFASVLQLFSDESRELVGESGGLWDKYTGDGFIAYWDFSKSKDAAIKRVLKCVRELQTTFARKHLPQFRANSQNLPGRVGLAIGMDQGPTNLVLIAGDPTIVGPAVVGAVRMVQVALAEETFVNVRLGEFLLDAIERGRITKLRVTPHQRTTKEYQDQHVYALEFQD